MVGTSVRYCAGMIWSVSMLSNTTNTLLVMVWDINRLRVFSGWDANTADFLDFVHATRLSMAVSKVHFNGLSEIQKWNGGELAGGLLSGRSGSGMRDSSSRVGGRERELRFSFG